MCRATFETSEAAADAVANFQKGTIKYAWCATCCCNRTATCSNVVFQQVHVAMSYSSLPCILLFFHSRIRFWLTYLPWLYKKVLHTSFLVPKIRFLGRTYHSFGDLIFFDWVAFLWLCFFWDPILSNDILCCLDDAFSWIEAVASLLHRHC